ncbi:hypothetical protein CCP2SC5_420011 [Azospirillaceae bacterium]
MTLNAEHALRIKNMNTAFAPFKPHDKRTQLNRNESAAHYFP